VITSETTNIAENVDKKCRGFSGKALPGNQLLFFYIARNEVPLTIFPRTLGGGKVNPSFRDFVLTLKRGPGNTA